MFQKPQHSDQNQKAVVGSEILAKAVTRLRNGRYEMIVVFALSTRQEFYWTFRARSPRSPRRSWKFTGYSARDLSQFHHDFGSFVSHRANLYGAEILSTRMPQCRRLAGLIKKTAHDSIYSDWAPASSVPVTFTGIRRRLDGSRKSRHGIWSR
jgi:hypothetical protein